MMHVSHADGHTSAAFLVAMPVVAASSTASLRVAQDNMEIQVYGASMMPPGVTMVELHSNLAFKGQRTFLPAGPVASGEAP
jgi:hypothetical protein